MRDLTEEEQRHARWANVRRRIGQQAAGLVQAEPEKTRVEDGRLIRPKVRKVKPKHESIVQAREGQNLQNRGLDEEFYTQVGDMRLSLHFQQHFQEYMLVGDRAPHRTPTYREARLRIQAAGGASWGMPQWALTPQGRFPAFEGNQNPAEFLEFLRSRLEPVVNRGDNMQAIQALIPLLVQQWMSDQEREATAW